MAAVINFTPTYKARSQELLGRQDIDSTVGAIALVMKEKALLTPVGAVMSFAGSVAPEGFLLCDGSAVNRTFYFELFALIGTTYGVGDGSTTFNLPNLKGRVIVGRDASQPEFDTLGETGGSNTHTLTIAEMPSHAHNGLTQSAGIHTHVITDPGHTHAITDPGHTHAITDPGHSHGKTDPGHSHGITDPGHFHSMGTESVTEGSGSTAIVANNDQGTPGPDPVAGETKTTGVTVNSNTTGITINTNTTSITNNTNTTGITNNTNTTGVTNQNAGAHQHVIDSQGDGLPHNNLQPYQVLNYIIKY